MTVYHIDFETQAVENLKTAGVYRYARHSRTRWLCLAFKRDDAPTQVLIRDQLCRTAVDRMQREIGAGATVYAHGAEFEIEIWNNVLLRDFPTWPRLKVSQMRCSMARGLMVGLPASLDQLAKALRSPVQKDAVGARLMRRLSQPNKKTGQLEEPTLEELERLGQYCKTDVDAEHACLQLLPPLPDGEQKLWQTTIEINQRGFRVDVPMIKNAIGLLAENDRRQHARIFELTEGRVRTGRQIDKMKAELEAEGVFVPSLDQAAVRNALVNPELSERARALLLCREEIARSSVRKYPAMLHWSCADGRLRGTQQYHGAGTGRFTGKGPQPHNFPRPTIKRVEPILACLAAGDYDWLDTLYQSPSEACGSALRSMIIPAPGKHFAGGDFKSIEARMLAWLAGDVETVRSYRKGVDTYRIMAARIFNIAPSRVTSDQRQFGKKVELGAGYQLGKKTFFEACKRDGVPITPDLAKIAIDTFRASHKPIVDFWYAVEDAAINAIRQAGHVQKTHGILFRCQDDFLCIKLKSGRKLWYYRPELRAEKTEIGVKQVIYYTGTKNRRLLKLNTYGGSLTNNITQGHARDILAFALTNLRRDDYVPVLTVHDEIFGEVDPAFKLGTLIEAMERLPPWAEGLPLTVEAWRGTRYSKS